MTLTKQQIRKVLQSIDECDAYIAKEEKRSANLRPVETQKLLAFYKSHRANLVEVLSS